MTTEVNSAITPTGLLGHTSAPAPGKVTPSAARTLLGIETFGITMQVASDAADTFYIILKAPLAFTINSLTYKTTASTVTAAVQIEGSNVTGLSALSCTTSETTTNATAANSVAAGNDVTIVLTSPGTSGSRLVFTLNCTRA